GYFFMVDRLKRMINAAGFKVWPTEGESILYKHPAVQKACVVRAPDPKRGETVKAFIILNDDAVGKPTEAENTESSTTEMAGYKQERKRIWRGLKRKGQHINTQVLLNSEKVTRPQAVGKYYGENCRSKFVVST